MDETTIRTRRLQNDQLEAFDTEYVTAELWDLVTALVRRSWPSGEFSFIDLGGGNGNFADRLLDAFPGARGTVLDSSRLLLDRNAPHPRKRLVEGGVEDIAGLLGEERFDLACLNWVLHHLVADTHRRSIENQREILRRVKGMLRPGGRLSVFENFYNGALIDWLPGRLIFEATASRALSPLTRRLGANTAGVGVCFRSRREWVEALEAAGYRIRHAADDAPWHMGLARRALLHVGRAGKGHLWCAPAGDAAPG